MRAADARDRPAERGLCVCQPGTQHRVGGHRRQACQADQQAERRPPVGNPVGEAGPYGAARSQTGEVDRQHHRKGRTASAGQGGDDLRPEDLVAHGNATGAGVQEQAEKRPAGGDIPRVPRHRGRGPGAKAGCPAIQPRREAGRGQAGDRRCQARPAHAQQRNQREGHQQGPGDGTRGIPCVEVTRLAAQRSFGRQQRANRGGQRAAHAESRDRHQQGGQHPGQRTHPGVEPDERPRRMGHQQRGGEPEYGHRGFEPGVPEQRAARTVHPETDDRRPGCQASEERGHADRDREDLDADDEGELLDPEGLEGQRGRSRQKQQEPGDRRVR